jgi:hypothetical protein
VRRAPVAGVVDGDDGDEVEMGDVGGRDAHGVNSAARNALIALGLPHLCIRLRRVAAQTDNFRWRMSELRDFG